MKKGRKLMPFITGALWGEEYLDWIDFALYVHLIKIVLLSTTIYQYEIHSRAACHNFKFIFAQFNFRIPNGHQTISTGTPN